MQAEIASEAAANRKMARRIVLLGFASAWLVAMVACSPMDSLLILLCAVVSVAGGFDFEQKIYSSSTGGEGVILGGHLLGSSLVSGVTYVPGWGHFFR